ncbi:hypothetical protein HY404_00095 [Candidatus Microgenomates bacterium]|nr:hypothetical protein [Candidatus Microgenomates bacterium]
MPARKKSKRVARKTKTPKRQLFVTSEARYFIFYPMMTLIIIFMALFFVPLLKFNMIKPVNQTNIHVLGKTAVPVAVPHR